MNKPWHVSSLAGRPTVDWVMSVSYAAGAPWNDTTWANERFNSCWSKPARNSTRPSAEAMYFEMQQLVRDDCPTVIPAFANFITCHERQGRHARAELASNAQLDGLRELRALVV